MSRTAVARIAAPAAFLAAVTVAVLLVRAGLREVDGAGTPVNGPVAVTTGQPARYHVVRRGDTLERIAARYATTVDEIVRLNPGVDPVGLVVGTRVRVR
jgi:LysM repeat protein